MTELTVATRGSDLAMIQTRIVVSALEKIHTHLKFKIKVITTEGDKNKKALLWELKNSGFFTSQLEQALLEGQADLAVHSLKDLPCQSPPELTLAAIFDRHYPGDCLVAKAKVKSLDDLKPGAKIGTCSLRRAVQLKRLRPDLEILPIRGNVQTRISLVEAGQFDAAVLALAGIHRLNLLDKISFNFDTDSFIPEPGQGALAVQTRTDDTEINSLVAAINDPVCNTETSAERQLLVTSQCGCHAPVGSFAKIQNDSVMIDAFICDLEGENFIRKKITGPASDALELAEKNALDILGAGGRKILDDLKK